MKRIGSYSSQTKKVYKSCSPTLRNFHYFMHYNKVINDIPDNLQNGAEVHTLK